MGNIASTGSGSAFNGVIPDASSPEFWRQRGDQLAQARNEAFVASKAAYATGDHTRAGFLSRQGKAYAAQVRRYRTPLYHLQ